MRRGAMERRGQDPCQVLVQRGHVGVVVLQRLRREQRGHKSQASPPRAQKPTCPPRLSFRLHPLRRRPSHGRDIRARVGEDYAWWSWGRARRANAYDDHLGRHNHPGVILQSHVQPRVIGRSQRVRRGVRTGHEPCESSYLRSSEHACVQTSPHASHWSRGWHASRTASSRPRNRAPAVSGRLVHDTARPSR
jgi:hypothetical protein